MPDPSILVKIVEAVAAIDRVDPIELEPLYEYINPEALKTLSEQERGQWRLTFRFTDHQITVTHDSQIFVDGIEHSPDVTNVSKTGGD